MSFYCGSWQIDAASGVAYFDQMLDEGMSIEVDDDRLNGPAPAGTWGGSCAPGLGLAGPVQREAFDRLVHGHHPQTDQRLTQRQKDGRRCYLGAVISAPKSISIAALVGQDERLVLAASDCARETMDLADSMAATRVRANNRDYDTPAKGLVYAAFDHQLSRSLDPQLHTHVCLLNCTQANGRWLALQTTEIFRNCALLSADYQSRLARKSMELGYEITKGKHSFELADIPPSSLERLSKGHQSIDDAAAQLGTDHAAVRSVLARKVRKEKDPLVEPDQMHEHWMNELNQDFGLVAETVTTARALSAGDLRLPRIIDPQTALRNALTTTLQHRRTITQTELEATTLFNHPGETSLAQLRNHLRNQPQGFIFGQPDAFGNRQVSTPEQQTAEQQLITIARFGIGQCAPLLRNSPSAALRSLANNRDQLAVLSQNSTTTETNLINALRAENHERPIFHLRIDKLATVSKLPITPTSIVVCSGQPTSVSELAAAATSVSERRGRMLLITGPKPGPIAALLRSQSPVSIYSDTRTQQPRQAASISSARAFTPDSRWELERLALRQQGLQREPLREVSVEERNRAMQPPLVRTPQRSEPDSMSLNP